MTYALFCEKCGLGSFCNKKIASFICNDCKNNQPERSKREDLDKLFPNGKCPFCNKGPWESLHQGCGALNTMET